MECSFRVLSSSHWRGTLLPDRSKLCESHWSNQWLTSKVELFNNGAIVHQMRCHCSTDQYCSVQVSNPSYPSLRKGRRLWPFQAFRCENGGDEGCNTYLLPSCGNCSAELSRRAARCCCCSPS